MYMHLQGVVPQQQTSAQAGAQRTARLEQQRRMHASHASAHDSLHTSIGGDPAVATGVPVKVAGKENGTRVAATVQILEDLKASTTGEEYIKVCGLNCLNGLNGLNLHLSQHNDEYSMYVS